MKKSGKGNDKRIGNNPICPYCGAETEVSRSQIKVISKHGYERIRKYFCRGSIKHPVVTKESIERIALVLKRGNVRMDNFSREKILAGIRRAGEHLTESRCSDLANEVIVNIKPIEGAGTEPVYRSEDIGECVLAVLAKYELSPVWVRFAIRFYRLDEKNLKPDQVVPPRGTFLGDKYYIHLEQGRDK